MRLIGEELDRGALADERIDAAAMFDHVDRHRAAPCPLRLEDAMDDHQQGRELHRLRDQVLGTLLDGRHRAVERGVERHQHDRYALVDPLQRARDVVRIRGELAIDDRELGRTHTQLEDRRLERRHRTDRVAPLAEEFGRTRANRGIRVRN
jgi:hypothetical protein